MEATGGVITDNGSYKVHTFASSGNFTVYGKGTVKVLVVGGGANSPYSAAGGCGGAGQVLYDAAFAVSTGIYAITINGVGGTSIFSTMTAAAGSGSTSGAGHTKGSNAGGPYGSSYGAGGGSAANGGNAYNIGDWTVGGTAGAGTTNSITGASLVYACGGSGGPAGGGSNFSGVHGSRLYGDGQGSNYFIWGGGQINPCPALGGVVIISFIPAAAGCGLKIGSDHIVGETLDATHKVRFNKNGTIIGLPLVATDNALASKVRIYDGAAVKSLVKAPA